MDSIRAFRAVSQTGIGSIQDSLDRAKEVEVAAYSTCSHCGKHSDTPLPHCSRCRAAWYCNHPCQQADFKARHKRDCAKFFAPPVTRAFLTTPNPGHKYPKNPVFAQGHAGGVGFWVSSAGTIYCDLLRHMDVHPSVTNLEEHYERHSKNIPKMRNAHERNLLSVQALIQNRRKDGASVLVYGASSEVISFPSTAAAVGYGRLPDDKTNVFVKDKLIRAALGVATDLWTSTPRLRITHFNGHELSSESSSPLPAAIKNSEHGVVELKPGDYTIMELQYRVGDGDKISKDWEAFACLQHLLLPFAVVGSSEPRSLTPSFPPAHVLPPANEEQGRTGEDRPVQGGGVSTVSASFNQVAVRAHYADFVEHGKEVYVRNHFGEARASMMGSSENMLAAMGKMMLQSIEESGQMDVFMNNLRMAGLDDMADKFGRREYD